ATAILPFALAFAGGTMIYVVSDEMIPETHSHGYERQATYALIFGFMTMLLMDHYIGKGGRMKITVISVGKIKEKYLKDAIAEYSKRLGRYCKLGIIEVQDEKTPDQASETVEKQIRDKEAERILKYIRDDMYVITLEIGGKMLSSEELA